MIYERGDHFALEALRPAGAGGQRAQSTRDYTDNQMLDHQTSLQKPRIALRRLFGNAGAAIRACSSARSS